jgi:fructose-bisphosphate aldolase class II
LRLAWTAAVREVMAKDPSEFDPRQFLKPAIKAMKEICKQRFEAFWTAGNASKIKPIPVEKFASFYK